MVEVEWIYSRGQAKSTNIISHDPLVRIVQFSDMRLSSTKRSEIHIFHIFPTHFWLPPKVLGFFTLPSNSNIERKLSKKSESHLFDICFRAAFN